MRKSTEFPAPIRMTRLVTRASTARICRRPPLTKNGAAHATPSYSLVPPGGFENSPPRGEIGDAGVDGAERSVFWYVDMAAINLSRHVKL